MIFRSFLTALSLLILIGNQAAAQSKQRYQSEKLNQRYQAERIKEQQEYLKRQPNTVIDIPKITFLLPGFSYEKAIGKFQTLQAYALYNIYSYTKSSGGTTISEYYFDPTIMLSYRYYCNHDRRQNLGKTTERNNMNYVGPFAQVFFSKIRIGSNAYEYDKRRPVYIFGAVYGMQRNYSSRFSLDINLGLGVISGKALNYNYLSRTVTNSNQTQFTIPGQVTLGFWLGKK